MIIVTTPDIPLHQLVSVQGLVYGTSVVSKDALGDVFASIKNFIGGNVSGYAKLIDTGRYKALELIISEAHKLSANAVVGLSVDVELMSMEKGGFFLVTALGTAVRCEPSKTPAAPF